MYEISCIWYDMMGISYTLYFDGGIIKYTTDI